MRNVVLLSLAFALVALLAGTNVSTQTVIPENHYLVYDVPEVYSFTTPVSLVDQFGCYCIFGLELDKFANPVNKNGDGFYDQTVHYT